MSSQQHIVVLTGPAAAGKNSAAVEVARLVPALAVVDIDAVRWMVLKPHVAPWAGREGKRQLELGVRNGCQLARNFVDAGFPVLIVDVLTDVTASIYREQLPAARIVQLLPEWRVVEARFVERAKSMPSATIEQARIVYDWQIGLGVLDDRIDSSNMSVLEIAELLAPMLKAPDNSRLAPPLASARAVQLQTLVRPRTGSDLVTILPYERPHLDGVIQLCQAEGWTSFVEDPERAHRALTGAGVTTMVALAGDKVVGFAQMQSDGEIQAHLSNIAVDHALRGAGLGRELVARAFERAGGLRVDLITESAQEFYAGLPNRRMHGFRIYPQHVGEGPPPSGRNIGSRGGAAVDS